MAPGPTEEDAKEAADAARAMCQREDWRPASTHDDGLERVPRGGHWRNVRAGCEASLTFVGVSASSEHLDPALALDLERQAAAEDREVFLRLDLSCRLEGRK